jgi:hypothetical protein
MSHIIIQLIISHKLPQINDQGAMIEGQGQYLHLI